MSMTSNPGALTVLCAGAMHTIVAELARQFERMSGRKVLISYARSGVVRDRVLHGESVDVVVTTKAAVDILVDQMKVVPSSATAIARSAIGVAIRAGAMKPDVRSAETFKRTLLDAKSIAYADPATGSPSGNHFVGILDWLGIAADVKSRTKAIGAGERNVVVVCEAVAKGEAEIGIQQISEILPVAGVELAGPLPPELQQMTLFSAAVGIHASDRNAGKQLIQFMTSPASAPVIRASGMEPA
jgi:molybdate transport system substrate-binding protein